MRLVRTSWIWVAASTVAALVVISCSAPESDASDPPEPVDAAANDGAVGDATIMADASTLDARSPFVPVKEPVVCRAEPCAVELVAGERHFCARMSDGTARCWGDDSSGQLGRGTAHGPIPGGRPVAEVVSLTGVVQMSAGGSSSCARIDGGKVVCWGANDYGQLGLAIEPPLHDGDLHPYPTPVALPSGVVADRVDVGPRSACAMVAGEAICWGSNERAQLARPADDSDSICRGPGDADLGTVVAARTLLATHTSFALTSAGEVFSWGALADDEGVLSGRVASVSPDPVARRIASLGGVTSVAVSGWYEEGQMGPSAVPPRAHACAVANGEVFCWGRTYRSALCTGLPDSSRVPVHAPVDSLVWPQDVVVSDELTCVRMTDGAVRCCGEDGRGRLGRGFLVPFDGRLELATAFKGHAVQLAATNGAVCALLKDGGVECWGSNAHGELGQETTDLLEHPTPVGVRL